MGVPKTQNILSSEAYVKVKRARTRKCQSVDRSVCTFFVSRNRYQSSYFLHTGKHLGYFLCSKPFDRTVNSVTNENKTGKI